MLPPIPFTVSLIDAALPWIDFTVRLMLSAVELISFTVPLIELAVELMLPAFSRMDTTLPSMLPAAPITWSSCPERGWAAVRISATTRFVSAASSTASRSLSMGETSLTINATRSSICWAETSVLVSMNTAVRPRR